MAEVRTVSRLDRTQRNQAENSKRPLTISYLQPDVSPLPIGLLLPVKVTAEVAEGQEIANIPRFPVQKKVAKGELR